MKADPAETSACQPSSLSVKLPRLQYYQSYWFIVPQALRDSSATEDITACSSLGLEECWKTIASSVSPTPWVHCPTLRAHFQPLGQILPREFLFLLWSLSWPVALFWWCVLLPLPPCCWLKCCFYWFQWFLRNQKSSNYSVPHSQLTGMPGTGGVCWAVKDGLQDVTEGPWGLILTALLVRPLSTYFKFPNLNCAARKEASSSIISSTSGASGFIH